MHQDLDRFLISIGWVEQFKSSKQRMLPKTTSNHCPILLEYVVIGEKGNDISNLRACGLNMKGSPI